MYGNSSYNVSVISFIYYSGTLKERFLEFIRRSYNKGK